MLDGTTGMNGVWWRKSDNSRVVVATFQVYTFVTETTSIGSTPVDWTVYAYSLLQVSRRKQSHYGKTRVLLVGMNEFDDCVTWCRIGCGQFCSVKDATPIAYFYYYYFLKFLFIFICTVFVCSARNRRKADSLQLWKLSWPSYRSEGKSKEERNKELKIVT